MTKRSSLGLVLAVASAVQSGVRPSAFDAHSDTIYRVLVAEDSRPADPSSLQVIVEATRHEAPRIRAIAVRALGRLERPDLVDRIVPLLRDPEAAVRREAANALGQAIGVAPSAGGDVGRVAMLLTDRLAAEAEPGVRGVLLRTIGRLDYRSDEEVRAAERALTSGLSARSIDEREGAVRGLSRLFARRPNAVRSPAADTAARLRLTVRSTFPTVGASMPAERSARVRRIALHTLGVSAALDEDTAAAAWRDHDWQVRRLAVLHGAALPGGAARARAAPKDPSPHVRFEALRAIGQREPLPCPDIVALARDPDPHVARRAVGALAEACHGPRALDLLVKLADIRPRATTAGWPQASTALGSLATACARAEAPATRAPAACARAAAIVREHAADSLWLVRMHAAAAAASFRDRTTLLGLARDRHPNVRQAAIGRLGAIAPRDDDAVLVEALRAVDYQLVMTAARLLRDSRHPDALPALRAAFDRLAAKGSDTARDPLAAIQASLEARGVRVTLPPASRKAPPFSQAELDALLARDHHAVVTMTSGRSFALRLLPEEAPATVARFVRLARRGVYDGLSFHRVEPNFVVQGGSPGANEYAGHDPYMRDEVGLVSHDRGTVGISTRGRDTGDAQIFVNLVDNPRLDHGYTVFARVVRGMNVVDGVVEGETIARITIARAAEPTHQKRFSGPDFLQN